MSAADKSIPVHARVKLLDGREGLYEGSGAGGTMRVLLDGGEIFDADPGYVSHRVPRRAANCVKSPLFDIQGHWVMLYPVELGNLLFQHPDLALRRGWRE